MIADHAVVSNQTNYQPNVIAAVDSLVSGGSTVTILGVSAGATSASIASGTNISKLVTVFVTCWTHSFSTTAV